MQAQGAHRWQCGWWCSEPSACQGLGMEQEGRGRGGVGFRGCPAALGGAVGRPAPAPAPPPVPAPGIAAQREPAGDCSRAGGEPERGTSFSPPCTWCLWREWCVGSGGRGPGARSTVRKPRDGEAGEVLSGRRALLHACVRDHSVWRALWGRCDVSEVRPLQGLLEQRGP